MCAVFRPSQDGESENPRALRSTDALLTSRKALSFGDFSLCQQRKVTRPQGGSSALKSQAKSLDLRSPAIGHSPMALRGMWSSMWSRRDSRIGRMRVPRRFRANVEVVADAPIDGGVATAELLEAKVRVLRGDAA